MRRDDIKDLILSVISEIPYGRVASYSQIAALCGKPKNAREVARVLSKSNEAKDYPCHRVIHNDGSLVMFWQEQEVLLKNEGIIVENGKVDMNKYRWIV